eukprot:CAMPEP_0172539704 /NCGR_PEP_ID=MMETSP1067-20121228/10855_1 /TAXON_ID=265564 ORGANISM="Thalassiosira punctigera, Strain Tpunct2005C2" /NCGR_SAMPLE_ID=MMETSP1067 /ASSEMBLY_ACC=CAM_ASM_000444 /LENGTH=259 /DNA_ID=CAMNT_0013325429 /DNA_START=365 /DNA_END=1142 /DNA_ORIENTATION=+
MLSSSQHPRTSFCPVQNSTLLRFSFFMLIFFLSSLLLSFPLLLSPFLIFRTFGLAQLALSMSSSFLNASFRFFTCVRCSCDVTVMYPSPLILLPSFDLSRSRTSAGIQLALGTWNRSSTFVSTLFTFCPPAPDERAKDTDGGPQGWIFDRGRSTQIRSRNFDGAGAISASVGVGMECRSTSVQSPSRPIVLSVSWSPTETNSDDRWRASESRRSFDRPRRSAADAVLVSARHTPVGVGPNRSGSALAAPNEMHEIRHGS